MGVPGLWDVIAEAGEVKSLVRLAIDEGFLSNKHNKRGFRIGIDASIWFFHAHSSREGENPELRMLFFRLAKFLALPLLPLFVFDGPQRPSVKRNKRIMGARHPLIGSFKNMIKAFGFEFHQAPGEAEAELAYLNRIEVIDAVLSDDVDNFLFGATMVIRNPSVTLTGNRKHKVLNDEGKHDEQHVRIFSSKNIKRRPGIGLTHGGFILIGLMSGGDYDTGGLAKCGIKTSHALARGGLGDALLELYVNTPTSRLPAALSEWRGSLRRYLATDPDKYLGRKEKKLAQSIPDSFPPLDVLEAYVRPVTSELKGIVPEFTWARQPSLKDITNQCEMHYEWGVKSLILKRFRTVIWKGALMRVLRAAVMEGDEKEARQARRTGNPMTTPMNGRRAAAMAVGTPSRLITQCLSGLQLESPRPGATTGSASDDPFSSDYPSVNRTDEDDALLVKVHSQRTHTSTDRILEYRLEINPAQFVRLVEQGFMHLRSEDDIDVENFGKRRNVIIGGRPSDDEEEFGDEEGDEEGGGGKGKKKKVPVNHTDHMRIWVPACMLEMVEPSLVEMFEAKEQKKRDRGAGKSPRKKAGEKATTKSKKVTTAIDDSPTKARSKGKESTQRLFLPDDSSDEEEEIDPFPRLQYRPIFPVPNGSKKSRPIYEEIEEVEETEYMSMDSQRLRTAKTIRSLGMQSSSPMQTSSSPAKATSTTSRRAMASSSPMQTSSPTKPSSTRPSQNMRSSSPMQTSSPAKAPSTNGRGQKATSSRPPVTNPKSKSTSITARESQRFLWTMKPDVPLDDLGTDSSEESEDILDPYRRLKAQATAAAADETSGSSRVPSGSSVDPLLRRVPPARAPASPTKTKRGTKGKKKVVVDMEFDREEERNRTRARIDESSSEEDFSHLFSPGRPTRSDAENPSKKRGNRDAEVVEKGVIDEEDVPVAASKPKKKHKFVQGSDSSDPGDARGTRNNARASEERTPVPIRTKSKSTNSASSYITPSVPPRKAATSSARPRTHSRTTSVEEVIDLSSDDEVVIVDKPIRARRVAPRTVRVVVDEVIDLESD